MTIATKALPSPISVNSAAGEWWSGIQVKGYLSSCPDLSGALVALGYEVAAGRLAVKALSASSGRKAGRPIVLDPPPSITPDIWWRIEALSDTVDIWTAPILSLPGTGNEKAVELVGLQYHADGVRRLGATYGYTAPIIAKPKSAGGISCRAHGVVIAKVTLDLLARGPERIAGLTGVNLQKEVQALYKQIDPRGLSAQNVSRVANGVLEVMHQHFSTSSVHSVHD